MNTQQTSVFASMILSSVFYIWGPILFTLVPKNKYEITLDPKGIFKSKVKLPKGVCQYVNA